MQREEKLLRMRRSALRTRLGTLCGWEEVRRIAPKGPHPVLDKYAKGAESVAVIRHRSGTLALVDADRLPLLSPDGDGACSAALEADQGAIREVAAPPPPARRPVAGKTVCFQPVSWEAVRPDPDDDEDAPTSFEVFGRTPDGESVLVHVDDFRPHFLIRAPDASRAHLSRVREVLKERGTVAAEVREDMWGFQFGEKRTFLRLTAKTDRCFFAARKMCAPGGELFKRGYRAYESNVDPLVSMIHATGIAPSSLVECDLDPPPDGQQGRCDIEGRARVSAFREAEGARAAPLLVAAFDIEVYSADGRFPAAVKDLRGVAQGLCDSGDLSAVLDGSLLADLPLRDDKYVFHTPARFAELARRAEKRLRRLVAARADEELARELLACLAAPGTFHDAERPDPLQGDPVIQIGTTLHRYGEDACSDAFVVCLADEVAPVPGARVLCCGTETEVLLTWARELVRLGPDVLTSWNGFGFDWPFLRDRAEQLGCLDELLAAVSRHRDRPASFVEKDLSSSALGDNHLRYVDPPGMVSMDLMKVVQADYKLDSYRLDAVSQEFLGDAKNDLPPNEIFARFRLGTPEAHAEIAAYCVQDCALVSRLVARLRVLEGKTGMSNVCRVPLEYLFTRGQQIKIFSVVLFEAAAAGYAVPDITRDPALGRARPKEGELERCERCPSQELTCAPPDSVKPVLCADCAAAENRARGDPHAQTMITKYEGAVVLDPEDGGRVFADEPVVCLDYGSLYPSCMLARQMCHSSFVLDPADFDRVRADPRFETYETEFELFGPDGAPCGLMRRCMFAWDPTRPRPILPRVLEKLLRARKVTRARIKEKTVRFADGQVVHGLPGAPDADGRVVVRCPETGATLGEGVPAGEPVDRWSEFEKSTLDGLQLGFKVVCNSLYGACGAGTSPTGGLVGRMIAQCVTREGRNMIYLAKRFVEERYGARVVYGDTDSVFVVFPQPDGGDPTDPLDHANRCGLRAEAEIAEVLPKPHVLEAEKVLFPLLLVSKKRYAGVLYEMWDPEDPAARARARGKAKLKTMGLKLKRRDSAPVTRRVLKGLIDTFVETRDVGAALAYMDGELTRFARGSYDPEELVMSQVLRAWYKVPPSHKYLADRVNARTPGAVQANDRIRYVFVKGGKDALIRDRIETPEHVRAAGLRVDLRQYLESQLINPLSDIVGILRTPPEAVREKLRAAGADRARIGAIKRKWLEGTFARYLKMADGNRLISDFFGKAG